MCAGGGVGVAPLLPIVEAFHKAGNRVIVVLAARTKDLVILEEQMRVLIMMMPMKHYLSIKNIIKKLMQLY